MEPLLCARHLPEMAGRGQDNTRDFPAANLTHLCGPTLCHSLSTLSHSQCPQVTASGILCTCFGSTINSLKQKTRSQNHRILLSPLFSCGGN